MARVASKTYGYTNNWVDYTLNSQNVATNTSFVGVNFQSQRNHSSVSTYGSAGGSYLKVNGVSHTGTGSYNFANDNIVTWVSTTQTLNHDSNGEGSIDVVAECHTHNTSVGSGGEFSGSASLPTIPRTSTINSITGSILEESFSLNYTKSSSLFDDTVVLKIGGTTIKTIIDYSSGDSIELTNQELLNAYAVLGDSTSGTLDFELITYNSGDVIGSSSSSISFTVNGTMYYGINGVKTKVIPHVDINGSRKRCIAFVGVNGVWKRGHTQ